MGSNVTTQEICMKEKRGLKRSFEKYHAYRVVVLVVKNLLVKEMHELRV